MSRLKSIVKENVGASLIAVIIAILFITAIGGIIIQITITNIRMKEIESSSKKNFYSAESVVDDFSSYMNDAASVAMKNAYTETLSEYRSIMTAGSSVQKQFSYRYLSNLKKAFADLDEAVTSFDDDTWETGKCKFSVIQKYFEDSANKNKLIAPAKEEGKAEAYITYELDYTNDVFILKNLHLLYDDKGYETNVYTDLVFHTPELDFKGQSVIKEFMQYSLIADSKILVTANAKNVEVDGNVYSGVNGIECSSMSSTNDAEIPQFIGNTIVTRGDIKASDGAKWEVGSDFSKVWARNILSYDDSITILKGTEYVEDDLSMEGKNSTICIEGAYYGYNFQKEYENSADTSWTNDSSFSSAIMINGKNSKLDLSKTKYLMLAGRTYIKRYKGTESSDIPMGESVSVRTNQVAYFVPNAFVKSDGSCMFTDDGLEKCAKFMGISKETLNKVVNSTANVTSYKYLQQGNATPIEIFYLNFASEQAANDFYYAYEEAHKEQIMDNAEKYVHDDALILGPGLLYTLRGDLLFRDGTELKEKRIVISPDAINNWAPGKSYWNYAKRLAQSYKTLQTSLEQYTLDVPAKVRIYNGDNVDKSADPLVSSLINMTSDDVTKDGRTTCSFIKRLAESRINNRYVEVIGEGTDGIILYNGNMTLSLMKDLNGTSLTGGIIICNGNVVLDSDFSGMIIASGEISIQTGVNITANESLVSALFGNDMALTEPLFSDCFYGFNEFSENAIGQVKIDDFLTYDNWTKSKEN